jgi:drug/metabolite transporter (DMT)-like permease
MKKLLRTIFAPILNIFESGDEPFSYKPSHRKILIFMGCLFSGMATAVLIFLPADDLGYLIPVLVFGVAGVISLVVGLIGTDRAVAKIWGSRK